MKFDVHAHYLPDGYRTALEESGHGRPDGMPWIPRWSAADHLAVMDRLGIAKSFLSVSSPGVHVADGSTSASLAREVNEDGRRAVVDHPGRFGLLASLPIRDLDATMAEISYCHDHLDVDGFVLLTNVGGLYLSDGFFAPVFDELNRRRARVLLHPTSPVCWERTSFERPRPMIEFLFDTTRVVVELALGGTLARCSDLVLIVPHGGAVLPLVADRVGRFARVMVPGVDVLGALERLHFDLAGCGAPAQLDALLSITTVDHLHYGSDFPFTPEPIVADAAAWIDSDRLLVDALRSNTAGLFDASA